MSGMGGVLIPPLTLLAPEEKEVARMPYIAVLQIFKEAVVGEWVEIDEQASEKQKEWKLTVTNLLK